MPKVYKYTPVITPGPIGNIKHFNNTADGEIKIIGRIANEVFIQVPDDVTLPEQELTLTQVVDVDLVKSLELPKLEKEKFRRKIELEIGDVQDLLADCMKMCEFALVLSARVGNEVLQGVQIPEPTRSAYAQRVAMFVGALDSGLVRLRTDQEDPQDMMNRIMSRYTRINQLYESEYKAQIDRLI